MEKFSFPFHAYDIQVALMQEIYQCIEQKRVGIFESPTGTGKSLSAICSVMTWLEDFEKNERIRLEETCKAANDEDDGSNQDDWIAAYKKKYDARKRASDSEKQLEKLKKVDEKLRDIGKHNENRKRKSRDNEPDYEAVTGDDDVEKDIAPPEEYTSDGENEQTEQEELSCLKIFYASRTHSQLEQFTKEIFKTRFRPRMVTLGSRQTLCLNEEVRGLKTSSLINEKCNELRENKSGVKVLKHDSMPIKQKPRHGCPYYKVDAIEDLGDQILAVRTPVISKVIDYGKRNFSCPYFASRKAVPLCQLVLLPYQVLLHRETRRAWGIILKDNIVVIDEAHNLLETIAAVHSVEVSKNLILSGLSLLKNYIERYRSRLAAKNLLYIRWLLSLINAFSCLMNTYLEKDTVSVLTLERFLAELDSTEIDFFKLLRYMDRTRICKKLHGFHLWFKKKGGVKQSSSKPLMGVEKMLYRKYSVVPEAVSENPESGDAISTNIANPLFIIKQFIESLTSKCEDARILIYPATSDQPAKFKFILLNPAGKLAEIVKEVRSLILVGGTMEPAGHLFHSLNKVCQVPKENITRFTCSHVIDDSQLLALSVGRASNGLELSLTFANRSKPEVFDGNAMVLLNLLRFVANGAVAFFPSYDYMYKFVSHLKSSKMFEKINALKPIILENKEGTENTWDAFVGKAQTSKGAVLFAIVGGKLSEGINFSDELGRCVFMFGLPYPNRNDVELGEKMKYLDVALGSGSGAQMYEACCLHAINQAIGRVIRHRHDYAAIILVDSRFKRPSILEGLPSWIRTRLKHCDVFGEAVSLLSQFFKHRKQLATIADAKTQADHKLA